MKVLQVIPDLSAGGAEGFVTNLGVSLAKSGTEVRFLLMAGARGERGRVLLTRLRDMKIEVFGEKEHSVRSPMNIFNLFRLIIAWRPEIVQANLYPAEVIAAITKILMFGSRIVYIRRLTTKDICGYRSPIIVRSMDRIFRLTIANSSIVAKAYKEFMKNKYDSKIVTIPNGGVLSESIINDADKEHARKALGISKNSLVIVHIGRMLSGNMRNGLASDPKAHDVLLKAFAKVFNGKNACMLVLVGDGPLRSQIEALAKDLGIFPQTRFLGQQPEPWPALKAADIFFFPSRFEGLPNVLPEAASCGLPVLAADIPEIRSLSFGDEWMLKPVDDVGAFALGLKEITARLSIYKKYAEDAAVGYRERYSMNTCADKYMRAYISILGDKKEL